MRSALIVAAIAGMATATPMAKRQLIEFDQVDAADIPDPTTPPVGAGQGISVAAANADADAAAASASAAPTAAASKLKARVEGDCAAQTLGKGPLTNAKTGFEDTAAAFAANPIYNQTALAANVPSGYALAFGPNQGATSASNYITYYTLDSFDPYACQQKCDAIQTCYSYNLYMERDPTQDAGDNCLNPASTTNIKCSLWGSQIDQTTATNNGQWRRDFQVVIAGSMGYNKLAAPPAAQGFAPPVSLAGAINAPDDSYMGYKFYPGAYNPAQCTNACLAQTAYNQKHPKSDGTYNTCTFTNSYVLSKNGAPQGTYCSMYSSVWGSQYAVNYGQYRGSDRYTVGQSYGWALSLKK